MPIRHLTVIRSRKPGLKSLSAGFGPRLRCPGLPGRLAPVGARPCLFHRSAVGDRVIRRVLRHPACRPGCLRQRRRSLGAASQGIPVRRRRTLECRATRIANLYGRMRGHPMGHARDAVHGIGCGKRGGAIGRGFPPNPGGRHHHGGANRPGFARQGPHQGCARPRHPQIDLRCDASSGLGLDAEKAIPLGLIASELLTKRTRHAFPPGSAGAASLRIRRQAGRLEMIIADSGMGWPLRRPKSAWAARW